MVLRIFLVGLLSTNSKRQPADPGTSTFYKQKKADRKFCNVGRIFSWRGTISPGELISMQACRLRGNHESGEKDA